MQRILTILFVLACHSLALASSWETGSFRTAKGQLIHRGMTMAEVRRDAGAPLSGAARAKETKTSSSKRGEVWMYQGNDGYYSISFQGGRVAKIEVTPFRGR